MENMHFQAPRSGELLDELDEYGEPTGRVFDKGRVHNEGIRHGDVHVWVTDGTHFLQQLRAADKTIMPNEWDISVAEHIGAGESFLDAAVRGTPEEMGLQYPRERFIRLGRLATQERFPGWSQPHNIVGENYAIYDPKLKLKHVKYQEEEIQDVRLYPLDQFERDLMRPDTARRHAPQPRILYALGLAGMLAASRR